MWAAVFDLLLRMSNMFKERRAGIAFLIANYAYIGDAWRAADRAGPPLGAGSSSGGASGSGGAAAAAAAAGAGQPAGVGAALAPSAASAAAGPGSPAAAGAGGALGLLGAAALRECDDQLAACVALYVEDRLGAHFGDLVAFVKKAEQAAKRAGVPDGSPVPGYGPQEAAPVLRGFADRWRAAVAALHGEAGAQFAGGRAARDAFQAAVTQLLLYYTRLLDLLKRQGAEGAALAREAVSVPTVMYEVKAYR